MSFPNLNNQPLESIYVLGHQLGSGAYSVVHLGQHVQTGKECAIKVVDKEGTNNEQMIAELEIMAKLSHPNIVSFIEMFDNPEHFYVILELISGGELFDRIIQLQRYSEKEASAVMRQGLLALQHMHASNYAHRDLKPENLLLSSKDENATVKLADFGFAIDCESDRSLYELIGTPPYMAPEIVTLRNAYKGMPGYGKPVDIWAMGVILYILLSGIHPFQREDEEEMLDLIESGEWTWLGSNWNKVSDSAKDLIKHMMNPNPIERYTAEQCLKHAWMTGHAPDKDLGVVANEIKKFQAKKKLKGAIFGVMASNKLKRLMNVKTNT